MISKEVKNLKVIFSLYTADFILFSFINISIQFLWRNFYAWLMAVNVNLRNRVFLYSSFEILLNHRSCYNIRPSDAKNNKQNWVSRILFCFIGLLEKSYKN